MPLISSSIPNLINGISQQPAEIRLASQGERQVNGLSSVARGLEKRPGTEHKAKLSSTAESDSFVHSIRRDRDEEYTMVLSRTSGTENTLSNSTLVNNDATVIVSSTSGLVKAMAVAGTGISSGTTILSITDSTNFELSKVATTSSSAITLTITNGKTLELYDQDGTSIPVKSAPTANASTSTNNIIDSDLSYLESTSVEDNVVATTVADTTFLINKTKTVAKATQDSEVSGEGTTSYLSPRGSDNWTSTYDYEGLINVKVGDYSSKYVVSLKPKAGTLSGNTYKVGFQTPASNVALNQKYVATPVIAQIIKGGSTAISVSGTDHWDNFSDGSPAEGFGGWKPTTGRNEDGETSNTDYYNGLDAIASGTLTSSPFTFTLEASKSVIVIKSTEPFDIETADSHGGNDVIGITTSTTSFSKLPGTGAPDNYIVKISGSSDATQDDFYVKYNKTEETWKETLGFDVNETSLVSSGIVTGFNMFTMPHRLIRLYDNQGTPNKYFLFEPVKEASASNGAPDRYGWSSRKAGDDTSNPFPSFTGGKINDICFHKNRFGILSDENIIFSVAGNFYNFFPISVMTGLESNPIDISVSNNEVSILKHAAAFDQSLLLFSDFQQFSLNSSEGAFTPSNVSVDVVTQFESTSEAPPVSSGKFVYFPFKRGEYSGVREYFVDIGSSDTNDATDITAHVPQYIKGTISKMVVSSTDQMIAVLSTDDTKRVYIYKNFWTGQEKIQNSWSHWEFDGDILNCAFLGSTLKLLVKRSDGLYLEDINLSLDSAEAVMEDKTSVLLDRRVKLVNGNTVAANLPYFTNKPSNMVYVTDNARKLTTEADVNEYLAAHATNVVYAGIPYTFEYEFSRFIHKENELPIQTAKLQVRNINLLYNNTGFFNVKVNVTPGTIKIPDGSGGTTEVTTRTNYSKNFSGMLTNTSAFGEYKLLSGTFKSSVMTNSSNCNIILENDQYLPCAFQSAEWEGFLHKRSQRV